MLDGDIPCRDPFAIYKERQVALFQIGAQPYRAAASFPGPAASWRAEAGQDAARWQAGTSVTAKFAHLYFKRGTYVSE